MKNQKGVTLISLTIYVLAVTVIIAVLSVINTYFYKNVNDTQNDITPLTEFTNFNTFFSGDANTTNVTYLAIGSENNYSYIALINEDSIEVIKYIYVKNDNVIYRETGSGENKTTIIVARNVTNCEFTKLNQDNNNNNKTKISIEITIGDAQKEYTYNLDND